MVKAKRKGVVFAGGGAVVAEPQGRRFVRVRRCRVVARAAVTVLLGGEPVAPSAPPSGDGLFCSGCLLEGFPWLYVPFLSVSACVIWVVDGWFVSPFTFGEGGCVGEAVCLSGWLVGGWFPVSSLFCRVGCISCVIWVVCVPVCVSFYVGGKGG